MKWQYRNDNAFPSKIFVKRHHSLRTSTMAVTESKDMFSYIANKWKNSKTIVTTTTAKPIVYATLKSDLHELILTYYNQPTD